MPSDTSNREPGEKIQNLLLITGPTSRSQDLQTTYPGNFPGVEDFFSRAENSKKSIQEEQKVLDLKAVTMSSSLDLFFPEGQKIPMQ